MSCNTKYTQFESLERGLKHLQKILDTFKPAKTDHNCDWADVVREQQKTLNTLRCDFAVHMTDLEQRLMENTLRIYGIAETPPEEDTMVLVLEFFRNKLHFRASEKDIDFCRRCEVGSDPRAIVVKFTSAEMRKKAWKKKHALPKGVTMEEELCPERLEVRNRAKKAFGDENVSVSDGVIQVTLPDDKVEKFSTWWQLEMYLNDSNEM